VIRRLVMTVLLVLIAALGGWAEEGDTAMKLQNNPFESPKLDVTARTPPTASASAPMPEPPPPPPPPPPWEPELRGTLVAGVRSVVNLGGVILALGDEFEGHRLVEVRPTAAVFVNDGERFLVRLGGETVRLAVPTGETPSADAVPASGLVP
jgi:hypothetical protein